MQADSPLDKFVALHEGEEQLRAQSLALISADEDMRLHAEIVERGQDLLHILIHDEVHKDDDDLTIRLLGIRLFNACAASLKLLFSGYGQNAALQMRDMLETAFLLDYFQTDRALIAEWRDSDKKLRMSKFGPASVRRVLDDRDGFTERKREAAYSLMCELASHPTFVGFQMLRPDGVNAHCGPFVETKTLKAVLSELAKLQVQAAMIFTTFIGWKSQPVADAKIAFIEAQGKWMSRFFNAPGNTDVVEGLKSDLQLLRMAQRAKAATS